MRLLSGDEQWALDVLAGPSGTFDAATPEGARLDAAMVTLIDRGCVAWRRYEGGCSFGLTDLGHLAQRVARVIAAAGGAS